jgi:hypothetical protein
VVSFIRGKYGSSRTCSEEIISKGLTKKKEVGKLEMGEKFKVYVLIYITHYFFTQKFKLKKCTYIFSSLRNH